MSLISEALKKAQRDRTTPSTGAVAATGPRLPRMRDDAVPAGRRLLVVANVLLAIAAVIAGIAYFHRRDEHREDSASGAREVLALSPTASIAVPPAAPLSPAPAPAVADSSLARAPQYDLAGMTVVGANTLLSIYRRSDKRSVWIPVGKTVGEITAVSYDPRTDRAVIEVDGHAATIKMRDGSLDEPKIQAAE